MGQKKPYNPNTAYGRRKLREQSQKYYDELPQDKKNEHDLLKIVIVIIICIVMFLLLGAKDFLKWASH